MPNPFVVDTPASAEELIDRRAELDALLGHAEGGHNSRLAAPRRYGKTTLLRGLGAEAETRGMNWVLVDFFGVTSLADAAQRIERAYEEALKGPVASWFAGVRRQWQVKLMAGLPGGGVELGRVDQRAVQDLLHDLLDLPKDVHNRTGQPTLVAFDEFQELLAAGDGADGLIRSRIQLHRNEASYVFAGSQPGLMAELFSDRERPLYGQARPVELGPLEDKALADYIDSRFRETGRDVGEAIGPLLALARGHPQRAMLLSHHLWERTPSGAAAGEKEWSRAVESALAELQETFERIWERLSVNERKVLTAVAWIGPWGGGDTLYSSSTQARFALTKGTTRDVSRHLERSGDLQRSAYDTLELVDPLFEAWIASLRRARV